MSISPYLTGSFVDFMINNKDVHRVVYLSSIIMLIGIAGVVLAYCKNTLSVKITSQVSFDLLRDITKHFEKVKLSIVETIDSTYLTQQINTDVNVITGFVISNIIPMFMNVILAMAIICLFISINKYLLVLMVVLIVPYIILYANMHQPLYEKFLDKKEADSKFFSKFSSQICQIFNIQLHSLYEVSEKELNHAFGNYLPVLVGAKKIEYIFTSVDSIIATIFQSIMFVIGGISIIHGGMTIGQFTMINTYFGMFLKIVKYYIGYIKELQDSKASFSRIIKIMSYDSLEKGNANVETLEKLSLKNLTFSYLVKGTENVIINKFTCDFYKGKKYAIIGPNGCGKSTLLKIITGLYTEFEGDLEVNGIKMKELDWDKLRKEKFSVVPQRLYLSSDSVIEFLEKGLAKSKKNIWGDPVDHLIRYKNANNLLDQVVVHANGDIVVSAYLPLVIGNIRKHSLKEYWDKGLNKVWSTKIVQFLVSKMVSISEMDEITNVISDINMDSVLYIDLIDNDLNDMTVIKDIVDKIKHYSK